MYHIDQIKTKFFELEWIKVYDFIEFLISNNPDDSNVLGFAINKIFEEEKVPYRIINNLVTPITSKEEIQEIKKALDIPDTYQPVKNHVLNAVKNYSKRPNADYLNSIKESIHALEALARIVTKNPKAILSDLTKELSIHPAFQQGINKIYGWSSDENGIRHSQTNEKINSDEEEARLILILSSAFVNYIICKQNKNN
jgi:hypothetical protein